jgi:hypothetical protein
MNETKTILSRSLVSVKDWKWYLDDVRDNRLWVKGKYLHCSLIVGASELDKDTSLWQDLLYVEIWTVKIKKIKHVRIKYGYDLDRFMVATNLSCMTGDLFRELEDALQYKAELERLIEWI